MIIYHHRETFSIARTRSLGVSLGDRPMAERVVNLVAILPLPLRINSMVNEFHLELESI